MMGPVTAEVEAWDTVDPRTSKFTLDCFLPTGVYVPLLVPHDATLAEIKDKLWHESQQYPLYASLRGRDSYHFMCINQMAEKEELVDEEKRVCDVKPFSQMLKVVERKGDKSEKAFASQVSYLIGKALHEFDAIQAGEVADFRRKIKQECKTIGKKREQQNWKERALYLYPPDVAASQELPSYLKEQVKDQLFLKITIPSTTSHDVTMTIDVPFCSYPEEVIRSIAVRKPQFNLPSDAEDVFVLKFCGRDEYLLGRYALSQFNFIRKVIAKQKMTHLVLISKDTLMSKLPPQLPPRPDAPPRVPLPVKQHTQLTWNIQEKYRITITQVANTNQEDGTKVCVRAGIYHGGEIMCGHHNTSEVEVHSGLARFNQPLSFDLPVADIPRMARLCFLLYAVLGRAKGKAGKKGKDGRQEIRTLAWVNLPVFDYKDVLRVGCHSLFMWPTTDDNVLSEEQLNALGTVECNPNSEEAILLRFEVQDYNNGNPVSYPTKDIVLKVPGTDNPGLKLSDKHLQPLKQMIERDPLEPLHEQDKERIWMLRMECLQYFPDISLPKLLLCVSWNKHTEVAQMQLLLTKWPPKLQPAKALELLDFNYPDRDVRSFAVQCLKSISDSELVYYLLQLVQVLKYECYLDCQLVHFLLERALNNQRIGHYFFWLLRSEMHVPSVSVRFGLILEAYCHGSSQHVQPLTRQVQALSKLKSLTLIIRNLMRKYNNVRDRVKDEMHTILGHRGYNEALSNLSSTLDPRFKLAMLRTKDCTFMDSKMKPLWMVWEHEDSHMQSDQPPIYVMYKDGDDLRQDMLTLQIIGIMDRIWQDKGYDFRMTPYQVLATGCNEGLIETVLNSKTVGKIQQQYTTVKMTAALNDKCIYQFLSDHHSTEESLKGAIEQFTLSCAGYCVATYVLGIGDRHADNIMLKESGQMFHIDFGHILGHFKSKFGYRRERVPFVLTSDFTYVINGGKPMPKDETPEFKRFRGLCEEAYMALHEESNLLITLFLMMMNTGIPELSNINDIEYLKKTLCPGASADEARAHFLSKFREAHVNSFSSTLNNIFHHLNHMK